MDRQGPWVITETNMADRNIILPENDRDLELARQFGRKLESNMPVSDLEDPVISELLEYRREILEESSSSRIDSAYIWNRINHKMTPGGRSSRKPIPMFSGSRWGWAAAASILIIITAGLLFFLTPDSTLLIAESQSEVTTVELEDGSLVTLRPFSSIYSLEADTDRAAYRLEGEGYFEVVTNPERTFSVTAGNGRVHVAGTRFVLSSWGEMVQLYLEEGSVQFETTSGSESTVLEPGQAASITAAGLQQPATAEEDIFKDWLNDKLTFSNRTAEYVFSELEQHFGIDITAPGTIEETLIGGTLQLNDLQSSLSDLGMVLGGNFTNTGNNRYTFTPDQND